MNLYGIKLAQNWRSFADDKQRRKCYNGNVQKWDRTIECRFLSFFELIKAVFFIAENTKRRVLA